MNNLNLPLSPVAFLSYPVLRFGIESATHYPQFLIGLNYLRLGKNIEAIKNFREVVLSKQTSYTKSRASLRGGQIALYSKDLETFKWGLDILQQLRKSGQDNVFAYQAIILLGRYAASIGETDDANRILSEVPESAGADYTMAQFFIQMHNGVPMDQIFREDPNDE